MDTTQAAECHLLLSGDDVSSAKGTTLRGLPNMEEKTGMSSVVLHLLSQAKDEEERGSGNCIDPPAGSAQSQHRHQPCLSSA